jgi:uncharacterized protein YllA (UPF0747 family)
MADAFGRWLEEVLGRAGSWSTTRPIRHRSRSSARSSRASCRCRANGQAGRSGGSDLTARGYHAQVHAQDDSLALFHLDGADKGRRSIRQQDGHFVVGDQQFAAPAFVSQATERPDGFSPNVLLRPIVQDTLFPTICYVAGPNELAYLGQLRGVYQHFGVPMPLFYPRATATLLDSAALRFLTKYKLPLEALQAQDEAALNELLKTRFRRRSKNRSLERRPRSRRR